MAYIGFFGLSKGEVTDHVAGLTMINQIFNVNILHLIPVSRSQPIRSDCSHRDMSMLFKRSWDYTSNHVQTVAGICPHLLYFRNYKSTRHGDLVVVYKNIIFNLTENFLWRLVITCTVLLSSIKVTTLSRQINWMKTRFYVKFAVMGLTSSLLSIFQEIGYTNIPCGRQRVKDNFQKTGILSRASSTSL